MERLPQEIAEKPRPYPYVVRLTTVDSEVVAQSLKSGEKFELRLSGRYNDTTLVQVYCPETTPVLLPNMTSEPATENPYMIRHWGSFSPKEPYGYVGKDFDFQIHCGKLDPTSATFTIASPQDCKIDPAAR